MSGKKKILIAAIAVAIALIGVFLILRLPFEQGFSDYTKIFSGFGVDRSNSSYLESLNSDELIDLEGKIVEFREKNPQIDGKVKALIELDLKSIEFFFQSEAVQSNYYFSQELASSDIAVEEFCQGIESYENWVLDYRDLIGLQKEVNAKLDLVKTFPDFVDRIDLRIETIFANEKLESIEASQKQLAELKAECNA